MLKAEIRQRKEYLFKKSEEIKKNQIYLKKQRLKKLIEENKPIPNDLKGESDILLKEIEYEDSQTSLPQNILDNEYYTNTNNQQKILVTTSRHPSQRLTQFLQEIRIIIPNSIRVNRGNIVLKDIIKACKQNDFSDLIILHENRGNPDGLIISHFPNGPTIFFGLFNVVLRHDIEANKINKISEAYPHLIFEGFNSRVGIRITEILKNIFPVPKAESKRVLTFANKDDFISFRHHNFEIHKNNYGDKDVILEEIGHRFELRPYQFY
jgi:U3 small nucleolar ribonucleoprotein protein IMP4